jgi:hypothetical protein
VEKQGFEKIQNLRTPEEFTDAKIRVAKSPGEFSGPWSEKYPWESN